MKGLKNFMRSNKKIEQIYVCKNNNTIISKFLIKFFDGSYFGYELPSFYNGLTHKKQLKELKKLMKELEVYLKRFQKQEGLAVDCFEHKNLIICKENSWLETYVDMMMMAINKENDKKLFNSENSNIFYGIGESLAAIICAIPPADASFILSFFSEIFFIKAILSNKNRDKVKFESYFVKKLKLYFSYLMLGLNLSFNFVDFDYNEEEQSINITLDKPDFLDRCENFSYLVEGIKSNTNLSEEDTKFILSLEEYILENPYFDYQTAYDSFTNLNIEYSVENEGDVEGAYYSSLNLIRIYNSDKITQEEKSLIMQHELLHCVSDLDNKVLNEGMTSLIRAEYFNNGIISDAYYDHVWLTKIFCELITPEKMLEAYSKDDMSIIEEEMLKINPNKEDYEKLMSLMNLFGKEFNTSSLNYRYMLSNEYSLSELFYFSFEPYYLNSDKVSEEAKQKIDEYIGYIGFWYKPINNKIYFNKGNEDNYVKKF